MANGLIDLQTDLTSLKYSTMPLGSNSPYIIKSIENPPSSNQVSIEATKRIDDTSRIAQMLIDKPGIKYLLHEAELQQINAGQKIKKAQQGGKTLVGAVLQQIGKTVVSTVKIAGSTLAQIPVNGTGTHFIKGFRTDTYLQPKNGNQFSGFAQFFGAGGVEGAQYALRGEEVPGEHSTELLGRSSKYDYDEYINAPILKASDEHKALAESGKPITIPGPQYETTAQPYELGRSNQIKEADKEELLANNGGDVGKTYNAQDTYTGKSPKDVIANALEGTPIPAVPTTGDFYPRETTALPGKIGESQVINKDNPVYIHPSISTNKYLGNSEKGPVPDASFFADGKIDTYTVDASKKNQESWGDVLQDTTAPEGTIGRDRERDPEVDSVPRFLPHIIDEKFDETGPPPNYRPEDTYLAYKRNIPTFNKNVTKESRVGLGDQGGRIGGDKLSNLYWTTSPEKLEIDSVNALDIGDTRQDATREARDFAKLYFEVITPDGSKFMHFRAFIDSIDDSYNANWEGHKYVGRAEDFYTYGGFSRDINISFKIVAATRSELKPLYKKMIYLASTTAPTYGSVGGFMRGTLARLTVGSYFDQIPGVITSVKYSLIDELPWELAMLQPEGLENGVQELPTGLQCSVSFKPIHDFAPQTGLQHYFTSNQKSQTFFDEETYTAATPPARKVAASESNVPAVKTETKAASKEQKALDKAVAENKAAKTTAKRKTTSANVASKTAALKNAKKGDDYKNTGGLSPAQAARIKAANKK